MTERKRGYRALPPGVERPSAAALVGLDEFQAAEKTLMESVAGSVAGHTRTEVWYVAPPSGHYLLRLTFDRHPDAFARSICTYTPSLGMDRIDGCFAEDVEAYVVERVLGVHHPRLDVFGQNGTIEMRQYLKVHGM
jgi:hypothetical protein